MGDARSACALTRERSAKCKVQWPMSNIHSAMSNVHSAIWDMIYNVKSAMLSESELLTRQRSACSQKMQWTIVWKVQKGSECNVLWSACLHCTLVALSDDRRGFNWSMASFVTDPEPTTRFPTAFSLKSLWLHQKSNMWQPSPWSQNQPELYKLIPLLVILTVTSSHWLDCSWKDQALGVKMFLFQDRIGM